MFKARVTQRDFSSKLTHSSLVAQRDPSADRSSDFQFCWPGCARACFKSTFLFKLTVKSERGRREGGGEGCEKGIKKKKKANEGLGETRAVSGNSAWLTAEYRVKCLWLAGPGSRERGPAVAQVLWLHDYKAGAGRRPRPLALPPLERRLRPPPPPPRPPPPLCGWTW